jgi:hypothetical protein
MGRRGKTTGGGERDRDREGNETEGGQRTAERDRG